MISHLIGHKHPDINISISFQPQYLNTEGKVICGPGSAFEGVVKIKTSAPIPVHHIKLVFKATGMSCIHHYKYCSKITVK